MSAMWVQPTGGALGADVYGVDLSQPMSDDTFQKILNAWGEHLVLRFSGQTDAQLQALAQSLSPFGIDLSKLSAGTADATVDGLYGSECPVAG